jgi:DNA polymerase III subunit epsilon
MKLTKTLVVLDLETTGTWIEKDKIIEIGMIKCLVNGDTIPYSKRVNPGMPIPPIVTKITGIKDDDVKDAPAFFTIAKEIVDFIGDADLAGFNVERFDIPLLQRELQEAGLALDLGGRYIYDAQKVFHLNNKRDLSAAYQFYCHKELQGAHSALVDTQATLDILRAQIDAYGKETSQIDVLREFEYKQTSEYFDLERKFRWWNGELYMMFGKYAKTESLRTIAQKDPGYLQWILTKDFSDDVKLMVQGVLNGKFPEPPSMDSDLFLPT